MVLFVLHLSGKEDKWTGRLESGHAWSLTTSMKEEKKGHWSWFLSLRPT
jgi:hypothetical protein